MMRCDYCDKGIKDDEKSVKIYENEYTSIVVHEGECNKKYDQEFLSGQEAIVRGMILGGCFHCAKPVRKNDKYHIGRIGRGEFQTTFPYAYGIIFEHQECSD